MRRTYPSIYDHTKLGPAVLGLLDPVGRRVMEDRTLEQATRLTLKVSLMGTCVCWRGFLFAIGSPTIARRMDDYRE